MGLAMIIPNILFDFYHKVNYFGAVLVLFLLFYLLDLVIEYVRFLAKPPRLAGIWQPRKVISALFL